MSNVTRRVQLGFGRLQAPESCVRRAFAVPAQVEREVLEFAQTVEGARALADLLDRWPASHDRVGEETLEALASGRLEYVEWSPVSAFTGLPGRRGDLAELSAIATAVAASEVMELAMYEVVIELLDTRDRPVPGEAYRVIDPAGKVHVGMLDAEGRAEIRAIRKPGPCKVSFPRLDGNMWSYVEAWPL